MTNPALDYTLFSCTQSNQGENIAEDLRGNGVNLVHFLKVASKLFYSSLHAGYFACFFCRRHVFIFKVPYRNTRVSKSHQGYVWVQITPNRSSQAVFKDLELADEKKPCLNFLHAVFLSIVV